MRTFFERLAAVLIAWTLSAAPAFAATNWDLFAFTGITHPITLHLKGFADEVKKRTNGELVITVRPAGELPFRATEVVKVTGEGQVQLGEAYAGFIAGAMPLASVGGLPMLIRTPEDLEKTWPIIDRYTQKDFEKAGVKVLFHFLWPAQNVFGSGKPVRTPEDLAGRKLRTADPKQAEMLKRLGASSVTLTTAEVPVAMERGLMEGVLSSAFNVVGAKWQDFIKWAWLPDLQIGGPDFVIVNLAAYNALPANVRTTLDQTARDWAPKMTRAILDAERGDLATLRDKYKVEVVVPPRDQVDKLTDRMKDYWQSWGQENGSSGTAMIKEIRAALGK
jgi:TRAP-type C4-dicarboxylate transport system substrate-binding protein